MSTRALIVGKVDGKIKYGQSKYDGYANTKWLRENLSLKEKVHDFFKYLTEGGDNGQGHGISSFEDDSINPSINWYDDDYFCNIVDSWEFTYEDLRGKCFDFPEYISYWDGEEWYDFNVYNEYDKFLEKIKS